ncbi:MAG: ribosomal protein S18-alanine N-acetyltransferase [candidate division Zixibacteria bacterium]|nr:ribosomal protein S18-alanine N-acetyltransferase [candidate division Zixibacteria bacterium]
MTVEDMSQIMALERQIFSDAWPQSTFTDQLGAEDWFSEVMVLGQTIIGYSCSAVLGAEMHLTNIAVAVEHRRKSVARRLLESILCRATKSGCEYVLLEVRPSNKEALAFYDKHGFDTQCRCPGYYHSPNEDALVLIRHLNIDY